MNEIHNIISLSPKDFVCIIRTTDPSYFSKLSSLKLLQKQTIDFLRDKCYVIVFGPHREFLNHAKFLIFYHVCFSEKIIYHGKYYGSTNLTIAGLAFGKSSGNYEEFWKSGPISKLDFSKGDEFYLDEMLALINHKISLYSDDDYLKKYLSDHLNYMHFTLMRGKRVLRGTTIGELYETYVDLLIMYNKTFALLGEIPGKKLTEELKEELIEVKSPTNPLELEMMVPVDAENAELLAEDIGLGRNNLRSQIRDYIAAMEQAFKLIKRGYLDIISLNEIKKHADEKEVEFIEFIKTNGTYHKRNLKKILEMMRGHKR